MSLDNNYPNRKVNMKNRLKKLGFKKILTEPGFHMYELAPAKLELDEKLKNKVRKKLLKIIK
jgi:hypothetical protein